MTRWLFVGLLTIHGLIHLVGVAQAAGMGPAQLTQPVGRAAGALWLGAAVAMLLAAGLVLRSSSFWWVAVAAAVALSQVAIFSAWPDTRFGTLVNALLVLAVVYGFASRGPVSFRAEYARALDVRAPATAPTETVTETDLAPLPAPVQRYLRFVGVVGRPKVDHFRVDLRGRIRGSPDEPWMEFTATQTNFVAEPARFFLMDARRGGLPVDVLHAFRDGAATMRVRLLSLIPIVNERGPDLTRAETVTLFNDLCLFAPAALVDAPIRWEAVDDHVARGHYTVGENTVAAELHFDSAGRLIDFRSDDRLAATPEGGLEQHPWSTPLGAYRDFPGGRLTGRGEGVWEMPEGAYTYVDLEVVDVVVNGALAP